MTLKFLLVWEKKREKKGGGKLPSLLHYYDNTYKKYVCSCAGIVLLDFNYINFLLLNNLKCFGPCRFNVLGLHEFDSDRKRMSVILGFPDKSVKVFVKGADTSMFSVIDRSMDINVIRTTEAHIYSYSSLGLRTLVIGMRELSTSEFGEWHSAFEAASTAVMGRASLLRKVASNIENNLHILGASGIEDKLQQGVPEAIESLRTAGIKVWVLTGDKQETAISIGYSSKLLTSKMTQIIINSNSKESCKKSLEDAIIMSKKLTTISGTTNDTGGTSGAGLTPVALIIDGTSLVYILDSELEERVRSCRVAFVFYFSLSAILHADVTYFFIIACSSSS